MNLGEHTLGEYPPLVPPSEFTCSYCGTEVVRDSFTYCAVVPAPDPSKQCPTCGHIPIVQFLYCTPECLAKARPDNGLVRHREREKEIEKIITSRGVDRKAARDIYMKRQRLVRAEKGIWKTPMEKPTFHKDFPKLAKDLGFRVYKQGWPDCLIERDGKYVAIEVKETSNLTERQKLMHRTLERAGLRVVVITPETVHLLDNFHDCLNPRACAQEKN